MIYTIDSCFGIRQVIIMHRESVKGTKEAKEETDFEFEIMGIQNN